MNNLGSWENNIMAGNPNLISSSKDNCSGYGNYMYHTPPNTLPAVTQLPPHLSQSLLSMTHSHSTEIPRTPRDEIPKADHGNSCGDCTSYLYNSAHNPVVVTEDNDTTPRQSPSVPLMHGNSTGTRKRAYTAEFKLQVVAAAKAGTSRSASTMFQVDEKCVRAWRRIEENLMSQVENGDSDRRRLNGGGRKPTQHTPDLEQAPQLEEQPRIVKRVKRSISLQKKMEIIDLINNGSNQSQVARMMGVNTSTIQTIWSNKDKILERITHGPPKKKVRDARFINIDVALVSWLREMKKDKASVDNKTLTDKANELADFFKESEFTLHVDWVEKWKARHNVILGSDSRVVTESTLNTSTTEAWKCIEQIRHWLVANIDDEDEVDKMYGHLGALERVIMKKRSAELRLKQSQNSSVNDFCTKLLSSSTHT